MGNSLEQWRACIGMFNSNSFICCIRSTVSFRLFLSCNIAIANLLAFCKLICKATSVFMKESLHNAFFTIVLLLLLLQSGDIETNPGPSTLNHGSLSILHSNIRSIRNKLDFIKDFFFDFNILCFTETHLDPNVLTESIMFEHFNSPYRKDCTHHGGGVLVYLSNDLFHKRKPELEVFCDESIWVEIKARNESVLLGVFYSPRTSDANFLNGLNRNIEKALEISTNVIVLGDLNEDLLNPNVHGLKDVMILNSLVNVVSDPTRINALLDPIIINDDLTFLDAGTIKVPAHISDHSATFITLPFQYEPKSPYTRTVWSYNLADFNALNTTIRNFDWSCLLHGSVHEASNLFNDIFLEMVKTCIPSKKVTVRPDDKPWYNSEIRRTSRKRDRLKSKAIKTGKISDWNSYKKLRNKVNNQKKTGKRNIF